MQRPPGLTRALALDRRAAIWSGLIGGLVAALLLLGLLPPVQGVGAETLSRMAAAIVIGPEVLVAPVRAGLDPTVAVVAAAVHFILSLVYAAVLGTIVHAASRPGALLIGALFGLGLYLVNLYGFVFMFPWFVPSRGEANFFAHVIYGLVLAYAYKKVQAPYY